MAQQKLKYSFKDSSISFYRQSRIFIKSNWTNGQATYIFIENVAYGAMLHAIDYWRHLWLQTDIFNLRLWSEMLQHLISDKKWLEFIFVYIYWNFWIQILNFDWMPHLHAMISKSEFFECNKPTTSESWASTIPFKSRKQPILHPVNSSSTPFIRNSGYPGYDMVYHVISQTSWLVMFEKLNLSIKIHLQIKIIP